MDPDSSSFDSPSSFRTKFFGERRARVLHGLERTLRRFSPGERLVLYVLTLILSISALGLLGSANAAVSVVVPSHGGELVEGVIGPARFINPLLALSEPDKDLTALIYSGLMRTVVDGTLTPDLASSYEISESGTVYTFTLRPHVTFHDGTPLTADDVVFTIHRAQSPDIKSPRRADWEGVQVSSPDPRTIVFTLPRAYAPFLENTTLGIVPKHLWEGISAEEFPFTPLNTHPIGSGPYQRVDDDTNSTGSITRFELSSFKDFALGQAFIKKITFLFYPNEEARINAFNSGRIDSFAGIAPRELDKVSPDTNVVRAPLPRTFGVFFNENRNEVLSDSAVRAALDAAIDKEKLVDDILAGYGSTLSGPIPPGSLGKTPATPGPLITPTLREDDTAVYAKKAEDILTAGGWSFEETAAVWTKKTQTLAFTLSTAEEAELAKTAEALVEAWGEAGIKVDLHLYPISELNSLVIRPRSYDAVLFGEVVGRTLDLFAFWHSSQRNDPGLNLSLYTNSRVDSLLAEARTSTDRKARERIYEEFASLIKEDQPAVFLFAPEFIYVVPKSVHGIALGALSVPEERFSNVHLWYRDAERVWSIFSDQE